MRPRTRRVRAMTPVRREYAERVGEALAQCDVALCSVLAPSESFVAHSDKAAALWWWLEHAAGDPFLVAAAVDVGAMLRSLGADLIGAGV